MEAESSASAETTTRGAQNYDVRAFGAKGDGRTLDTPAINQAIDAAANGGGGTVVFPAGTYLCYSIHLRATSRSFSGRFHHPRGRYAR